VRELHHVSVVQLIPFIHSFFLEYLFGSSLQVEHGKWVIEDQNGMRQGCSEPCVILSVDAGSGAPWVAFTLVNGSAQHQHNSNSSNNNNTSSSSSSNSSSSNSSG
jgi:hypothetical protein